MLKTIISKLPKPLRALAVRFDNSPIAAIEPLADFLQTRSAYVAQTSLYGYLKTRMGTSFRQYFEDDVFSRSIRIAAIKVFLSCLADLTIFAVGLVVADEETSIGPEEAAELACSCFDRAMRRTLDDTDYEHVPKDAVEDFRLRAARTDWYLAAEGENAFAGSARDLVMFAPVIDEFKERDGSIVANSIRFRWQDVRRQLRKRLDAKGVAVAWSEAPQLGDQP
ncbi:MAG: hypothetical protein AAF732_22965 [Pseudomonadota bacterium]